MMIVVVLPLVDEHKPKCYLCHDGFENIDELRQHQKLVHSDSFEDNGKQIKQGPAPGDVTIF